MALNSLYCADVPLCNYSLTHSLHSLTHSLTVFRHMVHHWLQHPAMTMLFIKYPVFI